MSLPASVLYDLTVSRRPVALYRLTRSRYASLSGAGAAKNPGRWNRSGEEAIYTSHEAACTVLELLSHTRKDLIPSNMTMMKIRLGGTWIADRYGLHDKSTGGRITVLKTIFSAYQYFGTDLVSTERPFAVALPSVVAPSLNVVLYPANRGFWEHVTLESVEPFSFDPRLFPKDAVLDDAL